jgi:hypothetical protein
MDLTGRLSPPGRATPVKGMFTMSGTEFNPVRRRKKNSLVKIFNRNNQSHLEPSYGSQMTLELLPFNNVMSFQLKRRGFNTKNLSRTELIALYYNEFVSNKDNNASPYKVINSYDFRNNASFKLRPSDSFNGNLESYVNRTHFAEVSGVVDRIVKHFKTSQLKKRYAFEQGLNLREALTNDELVQARATDKISNSLESQILLGEPVNQGQLINILFWGFLILALWYILE